MDVALSVLKQMTSPLKRIPTRLFSPRLGQLQQYTPRPPRLPHHYFLTSPPRHPPCISLVTPSFQQGHFLERTLRSVVNQNYPRLQFIVQDGGSQDSSVAILHQYRHQLFFWESGPDGGQAEAINRGFSRAQGEILAYLNADDLLLPGSLNCVAHFFQQHPEVDVLYGHRLLIDEHDNEIGRWILPPHHRDALLWEDFIPQETLFWRRQIWEKVGARLNPDFHFAMDWELLLRFYQAGAVFARLPRLLGAFRIHRQQKTQTLIDDRGRAEVDSLRQIYHGRRLSAEEIRGKVRNYLRSHVAWHLLHRLGL